MTVRTISVAVYAAALVLAGCGDDDKTTNKTSDLSPDQWAAELCQLGNAIEPDNAGEPASTDVADLKSYFADTYRQLADRINKLADDVETLGDPPIDGGSGFASDFAAQTRGYADTLESDADKIEAIDASDPFTFSEELDKLGLDDSMSSMEDPIEAEYPEVKKLVDQQPGCTFSDQEQ